MKHAGETCLKELAPLLETIRKLDGLKEKTTGGFYRKSNASLHFHEEPAGIFADVRVGEKREHLCVTTQADRKKFADCVISSMAKQHA
jgi:hypothetical protein